MGEIKKEEIKDSLFKEKIKMIREKGDISISFQEFKENGFHINENEKTVFRMYKFMMNRINTCKKPLTQEYFAHKTGCKKPTISGIENGKSVPSSKLINKVCDEFFICKDWLLYSSDISHVVYSIEPMLKMYAYNILNKGTYEEHFNNLICLANAMLDIVRKDWGLNLVGFDMNEKYEKLVKKKYEYIKQLRNKMLFEGISSISFNEDKFPESIEELAVTAEKIKDIYEKFVKEGGRETGNSIVDNLLKTYYYIDMFTIGPKSYESENKNEKCYEETLKKYILLFQIYIESLRYFSSVIRNPKTLKRLHIDTTEIMDEKELLQELRSDLRKKKLKQLADEKI